MSDIRFNQWLHQSGTGGVSQSDGGHVGIGTTNPLLPVGAGNTHILHVGVVTSNSISAGSSITATTFYGSGANLTSLPSQVTISNNADNRVITGGSGTNLNGEANMTFDGSTLTLTPGSSAGNITSLVLGRTSSAPAAQTTAVVAGGIPVSGVPGIMFGSTNTNLPAIGFQTPNSSNGHIVFNPKGSEKARIDSSGRLLLGTTTEGSDAADNFTISDSGDCGITIRSGTNNNGAIHFSDATSGGGEYIGSIDYDHANNSMNFYADNDQCLRLLNDKSVSISDKLVLENGTVFLNKHSVGIGTTTQTGRNAGVSTATGTVIYNAETEKVQVYANAVWRNVGSLEPEYGAGYYSSLSAAQTAGLSHYWPGNSSTALISGLQPDDRKGNPTFNNKEHDGYGATNPFFHFAGQTGGDNPTGYRFTHSADWVGHSFTITYWVKVMQEVTEGESTYVQLGNHSGLRSMFAMSCSGNTNLIGKTITIGSDNANDQIQYEFANWIHVGVRYNYGTNAARYFKNGVATETHTFSGGSLSVGTGQNHIYLGYGYWNSSTSNKESCSRMSDIGIWDSTDLNDSIMTDIYRAGRIVKGY